MCTLVKSLLLVSLAFLALRCGGSGSTNGSAEPLLRMYTPFLLSNEVWARTEADSPTDQGTWNRLTLPAPPRGATNVVLGLRGQARGVAGASRSRVWLNVRSLGAEEPAHHVLRLNAQDDAVDVQQQTLCVVPLRDGNRIEVWYQLELSGSVHDQARVSICSQGWTGGCGPTYSPFDPARELFSRTETSDLSDEDAWITVPLPGVPAEARVVVLNLSARAAGVGVEPSRASLYARASGSTLDVGDLHSAIGVTAQSVAVNRERNCILVPLAPGADAVDLRYRMLAGGGEVEQYRIHAYLQGYLTSGCGRVAVAEPYQRELEILRRDLGGANGDEGSWQAWDLSSVTPEGTQGVILGLAGYARGRVGDVTTQVRFWVRRPGDPEPAYASLALKAFRDSTEERGCNLVLCPLSTARTLEYRYELTPSGGLEDAASLGVYLQGVVGPP